MNEKFRKELTELIHRYKIDSLYDEPDILLTKVICDYLESKYWDHDYWFEWDLEEVVCNYWKHNDCWMTPFDLVWFIVDIIKSIEKIKN